MNMINNDDLQKLLHQWQLSDVRPFTHLAMTNNYVVVVAYRAVHVCDVVLKVGPKKVIDQEMQALQYFQGQACVKLLAFDCEFSDTNSALLLEYVQPGTSLKDLFLRGGEEESIEVFAQVVKKIHSKQQKYDTKVFTTAEQRMHVLHTFQSKNERLIALLPQAAQLVDRLLAKQGNQYLLHGDLHHENILKRKIDNISGEDKGRKPVRFHLRFLRIDNEAESDVSAVVIRTKSEDWVMIDPQGIFAELEYEVGAFIRNPLFELLDQPNLESLMLYRFERLSQLLNLDKQRMIDWTFVQTVLSACFTEQDGKQTRGQNYFLTVAELIAKITHPDYKLDISVSQVAQLIAKQFPQWADLPVRPVAFGGWDNKTFHLGDNMSVRLPSGQEYAAQVKKEQTWLPMLAQHISIPICQPIAMGQACKDYPFNWSVYRWIDGQSANTVQPDELDLNIIATQLAQFLQEMHRIDSTGGPVTDRGGSPIFYDEQARSTIFQLQDLIDVDAATVVWNTAIQSRWHKSPVWAHGDLSAGNILVKDKKLCAVIDFGGITIGDPACDLVIAWTLLRGESRQLFKELINLDEDTWARARGWALWKAMITFAAMENKLSLQAGEQLHIIHDILDEY